MNVHKNARLTPRGRERIALQVESGQTPEAVAQAVGVCARTVRKWVDRYRREGLAGLHDRSSRPHRLRQPTPQAVVEEIEQLRRQRWTGKQIAAETGVSPATVSRVLRRLGLNKLSALEPAEPVRRYEREKPGELIHFDIKKLGRIGSVGHRITGRYPGAVNRHHGIGWEFVHVCIDDASRIAFVQVLADQRKESAVPGGRRRSFCKTWRPDRARNDGQWLVLPVKKLPSRLQTPRPSSNLYQALYSEDQWKGRTLHSNSTA
jgi:transposase